MHYYKIQHQIVIKTISNHLGSAYPSPLPVVYTQPLLSTSGCILGEDRACCAIFPTRPLSAVRAERADEVRVAVDGGHPTASPTVVTTATLHLQAIRC